MDALVAGIPLSVLVIGIVAVARQAGLPSKYAPLASVLVGIVLAVLADVTSTVDFDTWYSALVTGIATGLMASGLYSGTKKLAEKDGES